MIVTQEMWDRAKARVELGYAYAEAYYFDVQRDRAINGQPHAEHFPGICAEDCDGKPLLPICSNCGHRGAGVSIEPGWDDPTDRPLCEDIDACRVRHDSREIDAAARRALAVTSVAELDHRARQIRLSYAPDPRCACGERFQHATNCPDDTEGN